MTLLVGARHWQAKRISILLICILLLSLLSSLLSCKPTMTADNIVVGLKNQEVINLDQHSVFLKKLSDESFRIIRDVDAVIKGMIIDSELETLKRTCTYVQLDFNEPIDLPTSIWVEEDERGYNTTDQNGYRIITDISTIVLIIDSPSYISIYTTNGKMFYVSGINEKIYTHECALWSSKRGLIIISEIIADLSS